MTEEHDERIMRARRKADAFTNALTRLHDDEEAHRGDILPEIYPDIREYVYPVLEREVAKATEEVHRLRKA